jgi:hypothetical protein
MVIFHSYVTVYQRVSEFLVGGDWNIHGNNMVYSTSVYDYINIYLVGGDWNHGI